MNHSERVARARLSLEGLSLGDAYGMHFEFDSSVDRPGSIMAPALPSGPWRYTDDTEMALSIYAELRRHGAIDSDRLARSFAERYTYARAYGAGATQLLESLRAGGSWRELAPQQHHGQGSCGNGSAMRVAPLGAFFADDLVRVAREAERSSVVTHSHPDGVAGAIAVAVAAALACRARSADGGLAARAFLEEVLAATPSGAVRAGLERAAGLPVETSVGEAVAALGNGAGLVAADTVPFALWSVAAHCADFARALELTASGLGDADTNCAIVGGVLALYVGSEGLPVEWLGRREQLPAWIED